MAGGAAGWYDDDHEETVLRGQNDRDLLPVGL